MFKKIFSKTRNQPVEETRDMGWGEEVCTVGFDLTITVKSRGTLDTESKARALFLVATDIGCECKDKTKRMFHLLRQTFKFVSDTRESYMGAEIAGVKLTVTTMKGKAAKYCQPCKDECPGGEEKHMNFHKVLKVEGKTIHSITIEGSFMYGSMALSSILQSSKLRELVVSPTEEMEYQRLKSELEGFLERKNAQARVVRK